MARALDVINRVRDLLHDLENVRWTDAEIMRWITDAQYEIVKAVPIAYSEAIDVALTAGTIQAIPPQVLKAIRILNNGTKAAPGLVPYETTLGLLDRADPNWRSAAGTLQFDHYVIDFSRRSFYVYPPSLGGNCVMEASLRPAAITDSFDDLALDDKYLPMVTDYVAARALSKDAEYVKENELAREFRLRFDTGLGQTTQAVATRS